MRFGNVFLLSEMEVICPTIKEAVSEWERGNKGQSQYIRGWGERERRGREFLLCD